MWVGSAGPLDARLAHDHMGPVPRSKLLFQPLGNGVIELPLRCPGGACILPHFHPNSPAQAGGSHTYTASSRTFSHCSFYRLHCCAFLEGHIVRIIQDVVFSDWFLSLRSMYLRFLHVSSWLQGSLLFSTESYTDAVIWMYHDLFICNLSKGILVDLKFW